MLLLLALCTANAKSEQYQELSRSEKLQAAYLFNFTKFIEWPDSSDRFARTSVDICLRASESFYQFMLELVDGRKVGNQKLAVKVISLKGNERCDIVYIQTDKFEMMPQLEEVLLVASNPTILPDQATITFYEEKKRLRFEVDMREVERLNINISSELLKLARIKSS